MKKIRRLLKILFSLKWIIYLKNRNTLRNNKVVFHKSLKIGGCLYISNHGTLNIGENCIINSGKIYNIIGGDTKTNILIGNGAKLNIGNNVGISNSTFVCRELIAINDDVLIGGNCKIYDADFHSIDFQERMNPYINKTNDRFIKKAPIIINKGAWIGGHCIILKGITIGEMSIIGAGSVLTKSVPPYEIWAGNPARFIRKIEINEK